MIIIILGILFLIKREINRCHEYRRANIEKESLTVTRKKKIKYNEIQKYENK